MLLGLGEVGNIRQGLLVALLLPIEKSGKHENGGDCNSAQPLLPLIRRRVFKGDLCIEQELFHLRAVLLKLEEGRGQLGREPRRCPGFLPSQRGNADRGFKIARRSQK